MLFFQSFFFDVLSFYIMSFLYFCFSMFCHRPAKCRRAKQFLTFTEKKQAIIFIRLVSSHLQQISSVYMVFLAYIANNMHPDQTAP